MSVMAPNELKAVLIKIAFNLGFDDVRFTENPLGGDKPTAAFLIKRYVPADGKVKTGEIALSEYYPASQSGYENTHLFVDRLHSELDIEAEMTNALNYKKQVLTTGGTMGRNSLYYHPEFGSFINMRCVLIGAEVAMDTQAAGKSLCQDCGLCMAVCPTGAIDKKGWEREKCLRNMMSEGLPKSERKKVYELLGCELCQLVCPMNPNERKEATAYDLLAVIKGDETKHLKAICGKNMATRTRLLTQALAFAAAKDFKAALPEIECLCDDELDKVREMAIWAKDELTKQKKKRTRL